VSCGRPLTVLAVLLACSAARAHAPTAAVAEQTPPVGGLAACTLVVAYILGASCYRRRRGGLGALTVARFASGLAGAELALLAVSPPAESLIGTSFAWHMGQHMVLLLAASALLAAGRIDIALGALLPRSLTAPSGWLGRLAGRPVLAAHVLLVSLWLWHLPAPWRLAEANNYVHLVDHAMLLGASVLYWRAVFDRTRAASFRPAATIFGSLVLIVGTGFLGAVLALAPVPLYGPGVSLADQHAGGILMWVPCGLAYAAALLWALDRWLARLGASAEATPAASTAR
jgi:putative membrane protein